MSDNNVSIAEAQTKTIQAYQTYNSYRQRIPEPQEFLAYVKQFTGITIPYKRICPGHNAPAEYAMASLYGDDWLLVIANRSGGKTTDAGIVTGIEAYHMGLDERILGGSGDQSGRMYEEFVAFLNAGFRDKLAGDPMQSKTVFKDGNKVQILVQSQTSVRGPHVPRLKLDEVEEFSADIYDAAISIAQSKNKKMRAKVDVLSTRHRPRGLMSRLWKSWPAVKLIWCLWEVIEACTDDRSCSRCSISGDCPGKEKLKDAVGYYLIDDAIDKKKHLSLDSWETEWLCKDPRTEGKIFGGWGKHNYGRRVPYDPMLPITKCIDAGTTHPTVVLYIQPKTVMVNGKPAVQYRVIMEKRWTGTAPSRMVSEMLLFEESVNWPGSAAAVDPAAAWFSKELEDRGILIVKTNNDRELGIAEIRNLLEAKTDEGEPIVVVDGVNCERFCDEMERYHMKNGKIVEKMDDGPDCFRYGVMSGNVREKEYIRLL